MSEVFFVSDLHFGHEKAHNFPGREPISENHDEALVEAWNSVVSKRDVVWVLGDVAFTETGLRLFGEMKGNKRLVLGNHDHLGSLYHLYFDEVCGPRFLYKGLVLSHMPVHPDVFFRSDRVNYINVHGHIHMSNVEDPRYFNVCVEQLPDFKPIPLYKIRRHQSQVYGGAND